MNTCLVCKINITNKKFCSTRCKSRFYNSRLIQRQRAFLRKKEVILSLGGKCSVCGYSKNLSSLTFHHLDPKKKDFQIDSRKFANCKISTLQKEISKCILVCRNCHAEIEYPHFNQWQTVESIPTVGINPTVI